MTTYPAKIDNIVSLPESIDNVTPINASVLNGLRSAIIAAEDELGIKPSGIYTTVRSRLDSLETALNSALAGGIALGQDIGGTSVSPLVIGIYGRPISNVAPTLNQVIAWNGTSWAPAAGGGGGSFTPGGDLYGDGTTQLIQSISGDLADSKVLVYQGVSFRIGSPNPTATTGTFNFSAGQTIIAVRDNGNTADIPFLTDNGSGRSYTLDSSTTGSVSINSAAGIVGFGVNNLPLITIPSTTAVSITAGTSPAQNGAIRFDNNLSINWRNAANTLDIFAISVNPSDVVWIGGYNAAGILASTTAGNLLLLSADTTNDTIKFGAFPSSTGTVRLTNTQGIYSRNAGHTADITLIKTDSSNNILIGDNTTPPQITFNSTTSGFRFLTGPTYVADVIVNPNYTGSGSGEILFGFNSALPGANPYVFGQAIANINSTPQNLVIRPQAPNTSSSSTPAKTAGHLVLDIPAPLSAAAGSSVQVKNAGTITAEFLNQHTVADTTYYSNILAFNAGSAISNTQNITGDGVIYIGNASKSPSLNPVGGPLLYSNSGVLTVHQPDGTIVPIVNAATSGSGTAWASRITPLDGYHIHAWEFTETSGTTFYDTPGPGVSNTPVNLTAVGTPSLNAVGLLGPCVYFPQVGTAGAIGTVPTDMPLGSFTIELWVNTATITTGSGAYNYFGFDYTGSSVFLFSTTATSSTNTFGYQYTGGNRLGETLSSIGSQRAGVWQYFAFVFDSSSSTMYAYVDGELAYSHASTTAPILWASATSFKVGYDGSLSANCFMSRFRISNIARSQTYLRSVYQTATDSVSSGNPSITTLTLDGSGGVSIGDVIGPSTSGGLVKKATGGISAIGIATSAALASASVPVQTQGLVPASVSGLGIGAEANAIVNSTTGKINRKAVLDGSEVVVGIAQANGDVVLDRSKSIGTSPHNVVNLAQYCALDGVNPDDAGVAAAVAVAAANGFAVELPAGKTLIITKPIEIIDDVEHGSKRALCFYGGKGGGPSGSDTTIIYYAGPSITGTTATIASAPTGATGHMFLITGLTGLTTTNTSVGDILDIWNSAVPMNSGHFCILSIPSNGQAIVQNFASSASATDANNGSLHWRTRSNAFRVWSRDCVFENFAVVPKDGYYLGAAFDITNAQGTYAGPCSQMTFRNVNVSGNFSTQRCAFGWIIGRNNSGNPIAVGDAGNCENMRFDECIATELEDSCFFVPNGTGNSQNHKFFGGTLGLSLYGIRINAGSIKGTSLAWEGCGVCFSWMSGGETSSFVNCYNEASSQIFSRSPIIGASGGPMHVSWQGGSLESPGSTGCSFPTTTRINSTSYTAGVWISPAINNGYAYLVVESGISGSSPPAFPTTFGGMITDGTAVLQCRMYYMDLTLNQPYNFFDYQFGGCLSVSDITFGIGSVDKNFQIYGTQYGDFEFKNCLFPNINPFKYFTAERLRLSLCSGYVPIWTAGTTYEVGDVVIPTVINGNHYTVISITTGISGGTDLFSTITTLGQIVVDGGVTWICSGFSSYTSQVDIQNTDTSMALKLDGSTNVAIGDIIGSSSTSGLARKASTGSAVIGVALTAGNANGSALVQTTGLLPSSITQLGTGTEANAIINYSTGRINRKAVLDGSEIVIGVAQVNGDVVLGKSKSIGTSTKYVVNLADYCVCDGVTADDAGIAVALTVAVNNGFPIEIPAGKTVAVTQPIMIVDNAAGGYMHAVQIYGGLGAGSSGTDTTAFVWRGASLSGTAATIASSPASTYYLITGLTGITTSNIGDVLEIWNTANQMNSGHFCINDVPTAGHAIVQIFAYGAAATDANNGSIKWRQRGSMFKVWSRDCVFRNFGIYAAAGYYLGAGFDSTQAPPGTGQGVCSANEFHNIAINANTINQKVSFGWVIGRNNDALVNQYGPNDCENFSFDGCFAQYLEDTALFIPNGSNNSKIHKWYRGGIVACPYAIRINYGSINAFGLVWEACGVAFSHMRGGDACSFHGCFNEASSQIYSRSPLLGLSGGAENVIFDGGTYGGISGLALPSRANLTHYTAGTSFSVGNGYYYIVKESGTTAASPPAFSTVPGTMTNDGSAVLTCFGYDGSTPYNFIDASLSGSITFRNTQMQNGGYDDNMRFNAAQFTTIRFEDCFFSNDTPFRSSDALRTYMINCQSFCEIWSAGKTYAVGKKIVSTSDNGKFYRAISITSGISGGSDPLITATTFGQIIVDNGITWICDGNAQNGIIPLPDIISSHDSVSENNISSMALLTRVATWSLSSGATAIMPLTYYSAETVIVNSDPGQACTITIHPHNGEHKEIINNTTNNRLLIVQAYGGTKRTLVPPGRAINFRCDGIDFWPTDRPYWISPSPAQILGSTLIGNFRADSPLNTPSSTAGLGIWNDLSGNGNHLIQATSGRQPIMRSDVNGKAGSQFQTASSSFMATAGNISGAPAYNNPISLFLITRIDVLAGSGQWYAQAGENSSSAPNIALCPYSSCLDVFMADNFAASPSLPLTPVVGSPALMEAHFAGNSASAGTRLSMALNGASVYAGNGISGGLPPLMPSGTYGKLYLAAANTTPTGLANETVCECWLVNRDTTADETAQLRAYAMYTYGIDILI